MAKLDPFSAHIVNLVRNMPDEALLELVKLQLANATGSAAVAAVSAPSAAAPRKKAAKRAAKAAPRPVAPAAAAAPKKAAAPAPRKPAAPRGRASSADKVRDMATVERVVKASKGMSASEIAKATNIPQERAASLVRELKAAKRIFQGGDRRFARYAGDAKTASSAAENARKSARGPRG